MFIFSWKIIPILFENIIPLRNWINKMKILDKKYVIIGGKNLLFYMSIFIFPPDLKKLFPQGEGKNY